MHGAGDILGGVCHQRTGDGSKSACPGAAPPAGRIHGGVQRQAVGPRGVIADKAKGSRGFRKATMSLSQKATAARNRMGWRSGQSPARILHIAVTLTTTRTIQ